MNTFIPFCLRIVLITVLSFSIIACSSDNPVEEDLAAEINYNNYILGLILEVNLQSFEDTSFENQIFNLVNEHRISIGLPALQKNILAKELAFEHNKNMISDGKVSHNNFGKRAEFLTDFDNAVVVGENVAFGFGTPGGVVNALLNSPSHRENIEGDYTHMAITVTKDENNKNYFSQLFVKK